MMNITARGQVKVGDKVYAYELSRGNYRLTGHGVEMVTSPAADGTLRLKATKGSVRNLGMRTLKVNDAGQLVTVS
jgi:hypothetical protein